MSTRDTELSGKLVGRVFYNRLKKTQCAFEMITQTV